MEHSVGPTTSGLTPVTATAADPKALSNEEEQALAERIILIIKDRFPDYVVTPELNRSISLLVKEGKEKVYNELCVKILKIEGDAKKCEEKAQKATWHLPARIKKLKEALNTKLGELESLRQIMESPSERDLIVIRTIQLHGLRDEIDKLKADIKKLERRIVQEKYETRLSEILQQLETTKKELRELAYERGKLNPGASLQQRIEWELAYMNMVLSSLEITKEKAAADSIKISSCRVWEEVEDLANELKRYAIGLVAKWP